MNYKKSTADGIDSTTNIWDLRAVMIDKSEAEYSAITELSAELFSDRIQIYLCWFHVKQAIKRWLVKHKVSKNNTKTLLHNYFDKLYNASTIEMFDEIKTNLLRWTVSSQKGDPHSPDLRNYLVTNWFDSKWLSCWAPIHRKGAVVEDRFDARTNNWLESHNRTLKMKFLQRKTNVRLADLVRALLKVMQFYRVQMKRLDSGCARGGRLSIYINVEKRIDKSFNLFTAGGVIIIDETLGTGTVTETTIVIGVERNSKIDTKYEVDVTKRQCTCREVHPHFCSHLFAFLWEMQSRHKDGDFDKWVLDKYGIEDVLTEKRIFVVESRETEGRVVVVEDDDVVDSSHRYEEITSTITGARNSIEAVGFTDEEVDARMHARRLLISFENWCDDNLTDDIPDKVLKMAVETMKNHLSQVGKSKERMHHRNELAAKERGKTTKRSKAKEDIDCTPSEGRHVKKKKKMVDEDEEEGDSTVREIDFLGDPLTKRRFNNLV